MSLLTSLPYPAGVCCNCHHYSVSPCLPTSAMTAARSCRCPAEAPWSPAASATSEWTCQVSVLRSIWGVESTAVFHNYFSVRCGDENIMTKLWCKMKKWNSWTHNSLIFFLNNTSSHIYHSNKRGMLKASMTTRQLYNPTAISCW